MVDVNVFVYSIKKDIVNIILDTINSVFNVNVKINELKVDLKNFYNQKRKQYNASLLLDWGRKNLPKIFLIIIPYDIYVPRLNFIFGVAYFYNGAVISTYRFRTDNFNLFKDRISKTIKHELGHVFGLPHCNNPCVMRFANSLYELDLKPKDFCRMCALRLYSLGILKKDIFELYK